MNGLPASDQNGSAQVHRASRDVPWRIPGDESLLAEGAQRYSARVRLATCPATFHRVRQNRRPKCAAEMVLPFAPIDTGATQRPFLELEGIEVDPALSQELPPPPGQLNQRATPAQQAMGNPSLEEINGNPPREVVIARAGMPHGFILGTGSRAHVPDPRRHRNQGLDGIGDVRVGDAKIAMTPLFGAGEETRRLELLEVPSGGGGRHARFARKLGR